MKEILDLVEKYINEKHSQKKWRKGVDTVKYSGPYFNSDEYVSAVKTLLNEWLVLGEDGAKFEKEFPKLMGKEFGVVTNSGSSANLLMMAAMKSKKLYGFSDKTKVLVPVAGFPTTCNVIIQNNFTPTFVDIELNTLNLDLNEVEKALEKHSDIKIITFAHVLGNPPSMNRLMELVKKYNLILLEDCCDALGSTYDNKLLGSFSELCSMSFYPAHHITGGEGGFISCNTKQQENIIRSLRDWGRECFCVGEKQGLSKNGCCGKRFSNWISSLPNEIFDHRYTYNTLGYNLKPIEVQCSILLKQMEKLPIIHQKRKENYKTLYDIFSKYEEYFILPKPTLYSNPSWFAFPLTLKNGCPFKRHDLISYLEEAKIQTRLYFGGNLLLTEAYQDLGYTKEFALSFKNATYATLNSFFLGTSPVIIKEQYDYIEEVVGRFFKNK